jgi:hypothetical protein
MYDQEYKRINCPKVRRILLDKAISYYKKIKRVFLRVFDEAIKKIKL